MTAGTSTGSASISQPIADASSSIAVIKPSYNPPAALKSLIAHLCSPENRNRTLVTVCSITAATAVAWWVFSRHRRRTTEQSTEQEVGTQETLKPTRTESIDSEITAEMNPYESGIDLDCQTRLNILSISPKGIEISGTTTVEIPSANDRELSREDLNESSKKIPSADMNAGEQSLHALVNQVTSQSNASDADFDTLMQAPKYNVSTANGYVSGYKSAQSPTNSEARSIAQRQQPICRSQISGVRRQRQSYWETHIHQPIRRGQ